MQEPADMPVCNILLADDHELFAAGFRELLLKIVPKGCSVDVCNNLSKAAAYLETKTYAFLFVDLVMPGENAKEFIASCRKALPDLVIIIVSSVMDANNIKECLAHGASGYVSKAVSFPEVKLALEYTAQGKKFISSDLSGKLASSILSVENTSLTKRELEVLRLIAAGLATRVIADKLFVSPITIMTHKRSLMRKLNVHSATELVKYAYDNHLV